MIGDLEELDARLDDIARHPFRAKFKLRGRDRGLAELHGPTRLREHALDLIGKKIAAAEPRNDGTQTPYRGHPVFVAQHATATCCRNCLARNHGIAKGHELTEDEREYVARVILRWIERQLSSRS